MAIMMVANDLFAEQVTDPKHETAFSDSVVSLFEVFLGFPPDGFPAELSRKVLKAEPRHAYRPEDKMR